MHNEIISDPADRRTFIGASDARVITGDEENALVRLWREKCGEDEPEDLSGNLIVQLGVVTEPLNRHWSERNSGRGYLRLRDFRKRTPSPPPFSAMNSIPAASMARCSFARASSETRGPNPPSSRLTVGRDSPARSASSD